MKAQSNIEIKVYADTDGYICLTVNIEGKPVNLRVSEDGYVGDHNAMTYEGQTGQLSVCLPVTLHEPNEE